MTFLTLFILKDGNAFAALPGDKIKPFFSVREVNDSNIFRVKDKEQLKSIIGDGQLYDSLTILTAGLDLNYPIRRQEVDVFLRKDFLRYSHYSNQDSDQNDIKGNILLNFLDRISVKITGGSTKSLESRENYRTRQKNERTTKVSGLSLGYTLPSGFSILTALSQEKVDFSLSELSSREYKRKGYSGILS